MGKRGSTFELNQHNVEDLLENFDDRQDKDRANTSSLQFLTKEEVLKSGRPILRLKRTTTSLKPSSPVSALNNQFSPTPFSEDNAITTTQVVENSTKLGEGVTGLEPEVTGSPKSAVPELSGSPTTNAGRSAYVSHDGFTCGVDTVSQDGVLPPPLDLTTTELSTIDAATTVAAVGLPDTLTEVSTEPTVEPLTESSSNVSVDASAEPFLDLKTADDPTSLAKSDAQEKSSVPSSAPETMPTSIFGSLFSQPFTNPFAKTAQQGEGNFASSVSDVHSTQTSSTAQTLSEPQQLENATDESNASTTTSSRPVRFPGEEAETELYFENNVILLKCVPITPTKEHTSSSVEENCPKAQVSHKFKRQGEGILRLLEPTSSTTPAQPPSQCRRLVLRQRGTWAILLNSPLWISKRFEKVPQMTGGFGVRFVGLSTTVTAESSDTSTALAVYCLKFPTESQRDHFLTTATTYASSS